MFAVLKTGGKQYKVAAGDVIKVEKIAGEAGQTVQLNEILMLGGESVTVGAPHVAGAAVEAEILEQAKGPKVINFVKRRRKHSSQRTRGHRQQITVLRVTSIIANGAKSTAPAKAAAAPAPAASDVVASKPANLLSEARGGQPDDLKKISGVGPKLEALLHENGVFHFDQIAAWSAEEIAYMDDQLSFKGRIERDGWIEQAKEFSA